MKQILRIALSLVLALAFINNTKAQAPVCSWLDGSNGSTTNLLQILDGNGGMKTDGAGNTYFVGPFSYGSFNLGSYTVTDTTNNTWFYYGKINASGKVLWLKYITTTGSAHMRTIAVNSQGHFVISGDYAGTVSFDAIHVLTNLSVSRFFIAEFDSSGTLIWDGTPGAGSNSYSQVFGLYLDDSNNTYCTGTFDGTLQYDTTLTTPFIAVFTAMLSQNGSLQWIRTADGSDIYAYSSGSNIKVSGNDVYVVGYVSDSITFPQNNAKIKSTGEQDIFMAKYTTGGHLEWAKYMGGGVENDNVYGLSVDAKSRPSFDGTMEDVNGIFGNDTIKGQTNVLSGYIVKCDSSGNILWVDYGTCASGGTTSFNDLVSDSAGNVFVAGTFDNATLNIGGKKVYTSVFNQGFDDGFALGFDTSGNWLWTKSFATVSYETGDQISLDNKSLTVAGSFSKALYVDGFDIVDTNQNSNALFFARMPEITTSGIEQVSVNNTQLSVFPNPGNGALNLIFSKPIDNIKVTNLLGQLVYESNPKQTHFNFQLNENGLYFITIISGDVTVTKKVIVNK